MGADPRAEDDGAHLAPDVDHWLRAGAGGEVPCQRVIETSISWIYLYADRALKLKKPLDLGFLDFSTRDKRRWACDRELAFNGPTAPGVYRAVHAITRQSDGTLELDGPGESVEWALEMRRFDETATLSNRLAVVDGAFAEALGRQVARFHAAAAPGGIGGGGAGLNFVIQSNAKLLRQAAPHLGAEPVERLLASTEAALAAVAPLLDRRLEQGFVRCCHGDLHLGNILLEAGHPVLFDCIEFNDRLREIDVLYDVAFLLMDLGFRDARVAANRVLNGWLDEAARVFDPTLWDGLAALSLMQSVRASVRAHVTGLQGQHDEARRYVATAQAHLSPRPPRLVAVGGLSGSGKSTLARALAPDLGAAPGAVMLRSDEIRKRIWRAAPTDRLPPAAYTAEASVAVYAELCAAAAACLRAGRAVILDAVFLRVEERRQAEAIARDLRLDFQGVWLEAPPDILRQRIEGRVGDASDADGRVLGLQLSQDPGDINWSRSYRRDLRTSLPLGH